MTSVLFAQTEKAAYNLCLHCVGVSLAALLCSAGSCAGTLGPVWCGKVLQTHYTQTTESSAVGALRGLGELQYDEKKEVRCYKLQKPF